jgi:hypothetical protein
MEEIEERQTLSKKVGQSYTMERMVDSYLGALGLPPYAAQSAT